MGKAELVEAVCRDIREGKLKKLEVHEFLHLFKALMLKDNGGCRCPECGFIILFGGMDRDEPYLFCLGKCGWGVFTRGHLMAASLERDMGGDA